MSGVYEIEHICGCVSFTLAFSGGKKEASTAVVKTCDNEDCEIVHTLQGKASPDLPYDDPRNSYSPEIESPSTSIIRETIFRDNGRCKYPVSRRTLEIESILKQLGINNVTCKSCDREAKFRRVTLLELNKDGSMVERLQSGQIIKWRYPLTALPDMEELFAKKEEADEATNPTRYICSDCARFLWGATEEPVVCAMCKTNYPAYRSEYVDHYCTGTISRHGIHGGGQNIDNLEWADCNPHWMEEDDTIAIPYGLKLNDSICDSCIKHFYQKGIIDGGKDGELENLAALSLTISKMLSDL